MSSLREETANKPIAKQRKLRKGTHSCWECKRRKTRCVFSADEDSICVGCRRRGTSCVNQAESDVEPETREDATNRRLQRIEAMLETLLERQGAPSMSAPTIHAPNIVVDMETSIVRTHHGKETIVRKRRLSRSPSVEIMRKSFSARTSIPQTLSTTLSETLHSLLPSPEECRRICSSTKFLPCFFQQMLTRDWKTISASQSLPTLTTNQVAKLPTADVHPILLAQKMLMLACLAQFVSQELSEDEWKERAQHMASAAIDVVAKDELCHNAEGLECMMLEATYHANNGDMRRAFSAVRRAMAGGQLLGIHRPQQLSILQMDKTAPPFDPAYMWYRIVSADRLFSLVLGLPQGYLSAQNTQLPTLAELDPEEQLDKQHSEMASWILDRNERDLDDMVATQRIDQALQDAASLLPSSWWLPPTLSQTTSRREMFLSAARLVSQILHFNLINQTHIPYLHRSGTLYGYNKAACATASREILHRYLILQDSSVVVHTFHIVEFFSLIAAMTLTLAHLERHWQDNSQELSVLAHTRSGDRAMIEQAINYMARLPACKGPEILGHLLQIEDEAHLTRSVGSGTIVKGLTEQGPFFELKIPYFGQLRLNSVKICFLREAAIEDISLGVKNRNECVQEEGLPSLVDFDFDFELGEFTGSAGTAEEHVGLGMPFSFQMRRHAEILGSHD